MKNLGFIAMVVLATVADIVSLLSFLGLKPNSLLQLILGTGLLLGAAGLSGFSLWTSVRLWLSPLGAIYPARVHAARIGAAILAVMVTIGLAIFVLSKLDEIRNAPANNIPSVDGSNPTQEKLNKGAG